jgi:hypothetical protein
MNRFKNLKYVSIDLETSGLYPSQILQFSAIFEDPSKQLSFDEIPKFNRYIKYSQYKGSAFALSLNSWILKILNENKNLDIIKIDDLEDEFYNWIIQFIQPENNSSKVYINAAGKNFASFDLNFIKDAFVKRKVRIRHRVLDPSILYIQEDDNQLPGSDELLKRAGINKSTTHNAIQDAWDVITLLRKCYNN